MMKFVCREEITAFDEQKRSLGDLTVNSGEGLVDIRWMVELEVVLSNQILVLRVLVDWLRILI